MSALNALPGVLNLPKSFSQKLGTLLREACSLNHAFKTEILKYDFEVFVAEPSSVWDPAQMTTLEAPVCADPQVISPVSLGIMASVSLENARVFCVHRKAGVLVDDPPSYGMRGWIARTMELFVTRPKLSRASIVPPTAFKQPPQMLSSHSTAISAQPCRTAQMCSTAPNRTASRQQPPSRDNVTWCL